jgi:hypothetical protein
VLRTVLLRFIGWSVGFGLFFGLFVVSNVMYLSLEELITSALKASFGCVLLMTFLEGPPENKRDK